MARSKKTRNGMTIANSTIDWPRSLSSRPPCVCVSAICIDVDEGARAPTNEEPRTHPAIALGAGDRGRDLRDRGADRGAAAAPHDWHGPRPHDDGNAGAQP